MPELSPTARELLSAKARERVLGLLDGARTANKQLDADAFNRSARAKVGEWGWSMSVRPSARQERYEDLADQASQALLEVAMAEPSLLKRWTALKGLSMALNAEAEAAMRAAVGKDSWLAGYVGELAEFAVMLDLEPDNPNVDRIWRQLSSEWRQLQSGTYQREPDVVSDAWKRKTGSGGCLGALVVALLVVEVVRNIDHGLL